MRGFCCQIIEAYEGVKNGAHLTSSRHDTWLGSEAAGCGEMLAAEALPRPARREVAALAAAVDGLQRQHLILRATVRVSSSGEGVGVT